jgi:VWFA-related protein
MNPTARLSVVALFAVILLIPWAYGQTTPGPASEVPTIITNAQEVSLDLVVRDKKDKPILDLRPEDITVTDNGSPVKLSDLRLVTGLSGVDHLVTLVFDRFQPSAAKNARDIASKILKMVPPESGVSFAVLKVDGRLRLLEKFTAERDALGKAIAVATDSDKTSFGTDAAQPEKELIAVAQTGVDPAGTSVSAQRRMEARMMLATLEESQQIVQDQHSQPALSGLLALARTERKIPGRKTVIFFAQGLQVDSDARDMVRSIVGAANRVGVSFYTIDVNALDQQASEGMVATIAMGNVMSTARMSPAPAASGVDTTPGVHAPPGMATQVSDQMSRAENEGLAGYQDPLAELAGGTVGAYIGGADSLRKPLRRLLEDMTTYYQASYVPSIENYDGRFRPVSVKPLRKGLVVRSRAGYFALPPDNGTGIRAFEVPLLKMFGEPQLPADLKFLCGILRMGDLPDGNANTVVVEVPMAGLEIHQDANTRLFSTHLSIVAQVKNQAGEVVEHFGEDFPRHGALETIDQARSEVITLQRHFIAGPGQYVLETAVFDHGNGKAGAQRLNFEIPNLAEGPSLSDVALVRRTQPFRAEEDPLEPLRYENGKMVPNLSGRVSQDAKVVSFFFMVHPDPRVAESPQLEMEVLRNGEPIGRVPLQLRKTSGQGAVPYLASLQAGSLAGGSYQASVTLTQGGKTSERSFAFAVDGPELASAATTSGGAGDAASLDHKEAGAVSDSSLPAAGIESVKTSRLVITSLANAVPAPSSEEFQAMVESARKRALGYAESLPNFSCVEMIDRSVDPAGSGRWRHQDSIAELLRYHDNSESRVMLALNGKRSTMEPADLSGTVSHGEFGGVLNEVFRPSSKAEFQWKETDALGTGTVQVLSYRVARAHSDFEIDGTDNRRIATGFHGLVYLDSATRGVRRITLEADDLPADFSVHATSISVDYAYIAINAHDYLMPIRGTVSLRKGKRTAVINEIEFRDYKRYGSQSRISYGGQPLSK